MSAHFAAWEEGTLDLAIDCFTVGLDDPDQARLKSLTRDSDLEEFERAVAAIRLAQLDQLLAPPQELLGRLKQHGQKLVAENAPAPLQLVKHERPGRLPGFAIASLLWAAALVLLFFVQREPAEADVFERRQSLIARAEDLQQLPWTATEDPAAAGAAGDVVWSSKLQEGYMRFSGLQPNDPLVSQYQLWIFDKTRADWEAKPVDGGVFDVSASGEVLVPIEAKLAVQESVLFAITVEVPGGVVVSEREHLILLAKP